MTLIASDGYEYEDLTQRLLGVPLDNARNQKVRYFRGLGHPEAEVRVYSEAYDRGGYEGQSHRSRHEIGLCAIYAYLYAYVARPN